ncbi:MAG: hypothetical protein CBC24_08300 [Candidatus Pelagibacter sp. TMED64]|nr:MAG: hypothetical protein CBC24_08300 [Candidatus Pelagibacter sp. TMED64]
MRASEDSEDIMRNLIEKYMSRGFNEAEAIKLATDEFENLGEMASGMNKGGQVKKTSKSSQLRNFKGAF